MNLNSIAKALMCSLIILSMGLTKVEAQVFTVNGSQLISPEGKPIKLKGWRIDSRMWELNLNVSQDDFNYWRNQGLLGNAIAVEFWFSRSSSSSVGEWDPAQPGVYRTENLGKLLNAMRAIARSGAWIIPSIRVSYDADSAISYMRTGSTTDWRGWAHHKKVIYNSPVVIEEGPKAGTYGNHGDRFFAWLDWIIPAILSDDEIADKIAYWEIWHFYGHRHDRTQLTDEDHDFYFDEFLPQLIAKFRQHDPDRLLGIGARQQFVIDRLLKRIEDNTWEAWDDKNWILVCGGYGFHNVIMADENTNFPWPTSCYNPKWYNDKQEFDIQRYIRYTGRAVHSQEGPGLHKVYRTNPIKLPQREYVTGLLNLYNQYANGFAWHEWPPTVSGAQDETDLFNLLREALQEDNPVSIKNNEDISEIRVFPNPSVGIFYLDMAKINAPVNYELFNSLGNLVSTSIIKDQTAQLDLQNYPKGIYLLKIMYKKPLYYKLMLN